MLKLKSKRPTRSALLFILNNLREVDKEELMKSYGEISDDVINNQIECILNSDSYIGVDARTNKPVLLYGVRLVGETGIIFMLSTNDIVHYKRSFFSHLKRVTAKFDKKYFYLCNIIYKKNQSAKKWLKNVGFKFDLPNPVGINMPDEFEYFYKIRKTNNMKGLY